MPELAIEFHRGGIHLPELALWLDPHEPKKGRERVFVSHAHSDHTGQHREIILSEPTSRLMRARMGGEWIEHVLPFRQTAEFYGATTSFRMTLLPAGHVFGSAMALIEAGGRSLLYTGDFKLRRGLSAEPCDPAPARGVDLLIMETTYGRPVYQFPPTEAVIDGVIRFCREAIDNEETPVLLGYSLGKSQELLRGLADARLPILLHAQVHKLTQVYEKLGQTFPPYEKLDPETARGQVIICPPSAANSALLRKLGRARTAVLTGWAVDPNCRFRYQVDAAFPLSDHADFPDLIEFVKQVAPRRIQTLHGFAADFAQTLRDLGYDAQALSEEDQLALPLAFRGLNPPATRRPSPWPATAEPPPALAEAPAPARAHEPRFADFAATCGRIGTTSRKLEKTSVLAAYLKSLPPAELGLVTPWFTGHPFPPIQNKVLQLGWAVIRDALCSVAGLDHGAFGQVYLKHSDLGETAREILDRTAPDRPLLTIAGIARLFDQLHSARGPLAKVPLLAGALRQSTAAEGRYLVKILTGDLRIGLKEGLVEEAIAEAFNAPVADVRNANLLVGNIAETAVFAAERRLDSASLVPFRPVKFMLASPEETAVDIWQRIQDWAAAQPPAGPEPALFPPDQLNAAVQSAPVAWIEDKYDGIRCQLHKVQQRVALYSRDLKEITATFLDLADVVARADHDFVLDGEIVAMRGEQILPFADLQKRLGRRDGDLFLGEEIPIQFIAFDLLWSDGRSLLNQPFQERRSLLETLLPHGVRIARSVRARSAQEIENEFGAARARGNEGLIVKDPASPYAPGRRGFSWLKLKKALATLDCVVVGAEYGHGRRKDVLSDYTFAVRDEVSGELKTIGKAYSGLTDAEISRLTDHFLSRVTAQKGRYHAVRPDTVLEIAFDAIQPSTRHTSGLAMRFPRIVRIREDKGVGEIDTVAVARRLVKT